jgi:phosphatidate cytidylyltransferase
VKRVLTALILIPIVVIALFRAPLWLFALLVLLVAILAAREYFHLAESYGFQPFRWLSYLFIACIFLVTFATGEAMTSHAFPLLPPAMAYAAAVAMLLLVSSGFILLIAGLTCDPLLQSLPAAGASFLLLPYVGLSLACMVIVRFNINGALFLLYIMLLVWTGDTAAYYVGRAIGKRKLAPRISPGKTWAGTVASLIGAIVVALLLFHFIVPIYQALKQIRLIVPSMVPYSFVPDPATPAIKVVLFAICINVAAQLGDLVESMLKRGGNIKDSGTLLPGHGGVLDRIDALLFALPVGWFFYFAVLGKYFRATLILG